jgi:hypothetical protein
MVIDHVLSLCDQFPNATLIVQDLWAKPTDQPITLAKFKHFFFQEKVHYFWAIGAKDAVTIIQDALGAPLSWVFALVFLTIQVDADEIPADHIVDDAFIEKLAGDTQEIYLTAYDRDGFVVWQRP